MRAFIGGLLLDGMDLYQQSLYTIVNDGLVGWFDGPGIRGETAERSQADGDYDLPVYRTPRIVTIRGRIHTRSDREQDLAIENLLGVCARGQRERLTIESPRGSTWAWARLGDGTDIRREVLGKRATYRLTLKCADPRRYGEERRFTGSSVQTHHFGNADASPVIEVTGPRAAYTITGPGGRSYQVTTALPSGTTDVIDLRTGKLTRGGSVPLGVVGRADVWSIPPGLPSTAMSISTGSMTVRVTDTSL